MTPSIIQKSSALVLWSFDKKVKRFVICRKNKKRNMKEYKSIEWIEFFIKSHEIKKVQIIVFALV